MGEKLKNDFRVDSNGRCFLCLSRTQSQLLQKVKLESGPPIPPPVHPVYSLQGLSRYLKMDRRKVSHIKGTVSVPPHLLDKLEGSTLKAELCKDCIPLNAKVSQLFMQLEKIQMEIESCLTILKTKLVIEDEFDGEFEKQNIFMELRKEANDTCFHKLDNLSPRVKIQQLTEKELGSWSKLAICSPHLSEISSESVLEDFAERVNKVKREVSVDPPEPDYESDYKADSDSRSLNSSNKTDDGLENDMELDDDPLQKKDMEMEIDSEDRKHSCDLCGFKFKRKDHLFRHRQGVHSEGPRFTCEHPGCDKSYSRVYKLIAHGRLHHATSVQSRILKLEADVSNNDEMENSLSDSSGTGNLDMEGTELSVNDPVDKPEPLSNVEADYSFVRISETSGPEQPRSRIISETGKIKCSLCPEDFRTDSTFQNHYQRFHLSVKCNLCGATYTRMDHYRSHHRKVHVELGYAMMERRCPICHRIFKGKHLLRHHKSGSCRMRK